MVPDPNDPTCCKIPQCDNGNKPNQPIPTGSFIGGIVTKPPTQAPTQNPFLPITQSPTPGVNVPNPSNSPSPGVSTLVPPAQQTQFTPYPSPDVPTAPTPKYQGRYTIQLQCILSILNP